MVDLIAIQLNSSTSIDHNLARIERLIDEARPLIVRNHPALILLPECAFQFGCSGKVLYEHAESLEKSSQSGKSTIQSHVKTWANKYNAYIVAGSMPILCDETPEKFHAASLAFSPKGERIAQYNKMHLFDVDVEDNTASYRESKYTKAGEHLGKFSSPWGEVGLSVCYDLRFSAMFSAMQGVNIVTVPSAFTKVTGEAHWHALLKARSIELQAYVIAANQVGEHEDNRQTFGNTSIYSPWGELLSIVETGEGIASAQFDHENLEKIRKRMPLQSHKKERYTFE